MIGDLHVHTTKSDGSFNVQQVINAASHLGVGCIAITDHDRIDVRFSSIQNDLQCGIRVIQGVEFSCYDLKRNRKVHILCYEPPLSDSLRRICDTTQRNRLRAGEQMAKRILSKYSISAEKIAAYSADSQCIYKQHLMHALVDAGYACEIYGDLYQALFGSGADSCAVPIEYPDVYTVLQAIHAAGGFAALAHPRVYDTFDLFNELISQNMLDGVEVWHPKNHKGDSEFLLQAALDHHLIPLGGSDFHGIYNSAPTYIGKCYTPQKYLKQLMEFLK